MRYIALLTAVLTFTTGCQSMQMLQTQAANERGITCSAIHKAFHAYQADRQSATAMKQLVTLISPQAGRASDQVITDPGRTFEQIRASTSIALAVKGCQQL
jgi:hypothetical protein